ncbi:MAG: chromate transporter [Clostridiales bacterium]|nr:chromate transporter [Clostridiales bacterium]
MLELFLTFLKIGAVSFGGGYGMISLLKEEVISHGWLTESQLLNFIGVSESTPGPIAINMATFVGSSQYGIWGALLATLGVVLPAFVIMLVVASLISGLLKFAGVKSFLNGVRPVVIGLIVATAITMFLSVILSFESIGSEVFFDYKALIIFAVVATCGILYKHFTKKALSPIILILISAVMGLIFYGLL